MRVGGSLAGIGKKCPRDSETHFSKPRVPFAPKPQRLDLSPGSGCAELRKINLLLVK
jgi:hypothetical protein